MSSTAEIDNILASGDLPLIGAVPDSGPNRDTDWSALPNGRKARLTGAAAGLRGVDLDTYIVFAENADRAGHRMRTGMPRIAVEAGLTRRNVIHARDRLVAGAWLRCDRASKGGIVRPGKPNPTGEWSVYLSPRAVEIVEWGKNGELRKAVGAPTKSQRRRALDPHAGRRLWGRS